MAAPTPQSNEPNIHAEFANAIRRAGLILDGEPLMDGQLHRVPVVNGKPRAKDGTYVGFTDGRPAGYIQNFLSGTRETWTTEGKELSPAEREHLAAHAQLAKLQRASDLSAQHQTAAERVQAKWDRLSDAPPREENAYLARKGVEAFGVKFNGDKLVVPARDVDGKLWSLQNISPEEGGPKLFEKGGRKTGNFHMIGDPKPGEPILIAEGYATAASLHQATQRPVVVAFDSGNIDPVVSALKKRYADNPMFVMGDDDHRQKVNVGVEKAMGAATKHQIGVAFPVFEVKHGLSDYNDLHATQGLAAVKSQVEATVGVPMAESREAARAWLSLTQAPAVAPPSASDSNDQARAPRQDPVPIEGAPASQPDRRADSQPTERGSIDTRVATEQSVPSMEGRVAAPVPASASPRAELGATTDSVAQAATGTLEAGRNPAPDKANIPESPEKRGQRVPQLPADAAMQAAGTQTLAREIANPELDGGALLNAISHRNSDAMAAPRNSVTAEVAARWAAQDIADLAQVKGDAQRVEALYRVGENAQAHPIYQTELTRRAPEIAQVAAETYMDASAHLVATQREIGRPSWLNAEELTNLADRHAEVRRESGSVDLLPRDRAEALAREDVLSLQRLRGVDGEPQAYALLADALKSEQYRDSFSRESARLPDSLSVVDGTSYAAGEQRRYDVGVSDAQHRKEVERRSHDLQGVQRDGLSPTVAADVVRLDLQALRATEHPWERLLIAEGMAGNSARQASYKSGLAKQDPEIGQSVDQFARLGRSAHDVLKSDRPHITGVRPADVSAPDDGTLPLIFRGTFASERTGRLTPVGISAEAYTSTLSRADRPVWDNKQFTIASAPGMVGDFTTGHKDAVVALARSRGLLLEDDPIGRYLRIQPPSPDRTKLAHRTAALATPINAITLRARDQEFDDAGTAALRSRVARANAVELNDPSKLAAGERTLETISRMTRKELEDFEQAVKRSPERVQSVLDSAQKRIEGGVQTRVGREPVPPLNERYNVVAHLLSREYQFRDKPGTAFTEGLLRLKTSHESVDVIKGMLDRADQLGWSTVNFSGSAEFKRQAWIAASARGIKGVGHTPTDGDRAAAESERQRLGREPSPAQQTGGTITRGRADARGESQAPGHGVTQERTAAATRPVEGQAAVGAPAPTSAQSANGPRQGGVEREPAVAQQVRAYLAGVGESPGNADAVAAIAASRMSSERVYVGLLTARDYAPYEFKQNAKESPYVKLKGPDGEKTVWGVDLPRALDDAGVKLGDSIALEFRGMKAVTVPVKDLDKAGQVVGWHDETVNRNTWYAAKVDDLRAEALKPAPAPTAAMPNAPEAQASEPTPKAPDRLASQPVPAPPLPAVGSAPPKPPAHVPTGDGGLDGVSASGMRRTPEPAAAPVHTERQALTISRDTEEPAFAALDAALVKRSVPTALHEPLREIFGRELAARQTQGEAISIKVFDAAAARAVSRVTPGETDQSPQRSEVKIRR